MTRQYILSTIAAALEQHRPELPADDTSRLILRQARAAVNHGFTQWPWYRAAASRIVRECGSIYVLIWDVAALTTTRVCDGEPVEDASRAAMLELLKQLRREYDGARVPDVVDIPSTDFEAVALCQSAHGPDHVEIAHLYAIADDSERQLLDALSEGQSVRATAEMIGIARSTLRDRIVRLRSKYEQEDAYA